MEVSRIDDIIESAFEREKVPCCQVTQYPLCTLRPRDAALVRTYSDARNQLTGVIDSPDTLRSVVENFTRALVWVLLHEVRRCKQDPANNSIAGNIDANSRPSSASPIQNTDVVQTNESKGNSVILESNKNSRVSESQCGSIHAVGSTTSLGAWSDCDSLLGTPEHKQNKVSLLHSQVKDSYDSPTTSQHEMQPVGGIKPEGNNLHDVDNLFEELGFGMPAVDINQPSPVALANSKLPTLFPNGTAVTASKGTMLLDASHLALQLSAQLVPPRKWLHVPVERSKLASVMSDFPVDWYQHVVRGLSFKPAGKRNVHDVAEEVAGDVELQKVYSQLVMACHLVVNVLGEAMYGRFQSKI